MLPAYQQNLNSANLKAIAEMNFFTYKFHTDNGADLQIRKPFLESYLLYEKCAKEAEDKEINLKKNRAWKNSKGDGKRMWKLIDWKGKADLKKEPLIHHTDITPYFKKIFQSDKTKNHPKVGAAKNELDTYNNYVEQTDKDFDTAELLRAVKKVGSGISLDGIPSSVIKMLPPPFLTVVLQLLQRVFLGEYPEQWEKQILNAVSKSGHTLKKPQLRGIGVAPVLGRTYDIMLDQRFLTWYKPNREQSAFRLMHGCPFPLFCVFLLLHYSKQENKDLCIGFMDYEKAFDYANRAHIVLKLIEKGCGRTFTEAVFKMFRATTYVPSYENKLCEEITTSYGVAQGRNSSPNFYSFFVSDMPRCMDSLEEKDFIHPHNLAQLADDAAVLADGLIMLGEKMGCVLDHSEEIYQVPNVPKTVFCHFSDEPYTGKLRINDNTELSSVDKKKGHRYLGCKFLPTINIDMIISFNVDDRKHNWVKFYGWLDDNAETPIEIKLLVLDNCLFCSILYGFEVFGKIECVEKELRVAEQKALRAILKVKKGTSIDLLYNELKRADIISVIKEAQYKFFAKVGTLEEEEALVVSILRLCENTPIVEYYKSLLPNSRKNNIDERERSD